MHTFNNVITRVLFYFTRFWIGITLLLLLLLLLFERQVWSHFQLLKHCQKGMA
ncbi:MAG: hypothetical protein N7Q72_00260 [Spiroplasma sp. Tabriz.8]|nr:hypothetical protein [Spiroplasma sp. Tabriz.8]